MMTVCVLRVQRESRVDATWDQADSSARHTLLVPIPFTYHTVKEKVGRGERPHRSQGNPGISGRAG